MAQNGCTDPQAINYDNTATINDGTCNYPPTSYILTELAQLSDAIMETSGLVYFDQQLWTTNDAGNDNELYRIDTLTGAILQTALIVGAENFDWEDLAQDESHIYIGDFGNNIGNRTNLRVYKINKSELPNNIVNSELIEFTFSDQTDFSPDNNNHNYDCEAFFYHNDSLYLFSKNWVDMKTRMYTLSTSPGVQVAVLRDSLEAGGLITGATINNDGVVALLGYTVSEGFMWLLSDYNGTNFFSGNKRRISFGSVLNISQIEGITFSEGGRGFISAENFSVLSPKLHRFSTHQWFELPTSLSTIHQQQFSVYPNPVSDYVYIKFENSLPDEIDLSLYNLLGQQIDLRYYQRSRSSFELNLGDLPLGHYILRLKIGEQIFSSTLVKNAK